MAQSLDPDTGSRRIELNLRYGLFTLAYMAIISWFTSQPEPRTSGGGPLVQLAVNLYHMPLYAGLGFFVLQAISRGQALAAHRRTRAAVTVVVTGVIAALDEWHQVYVPGRDPSLFDVLLDLAGVVGLLLLCWLGTARELRS